MKTESIEDLTLRIEGEMRSLALAHAKEKSWVLRFGANHIHPRHLVFVVCVLTDAEKKRLESDFEFLRQLRALLDKHDYPIAARKDVVIDFESQETVDRESGGNWYYHLK
jgi:hypothetical protein